MKGAAFPIRRRVIILLMTCALTGLGVGLGAMYPRFGYDNIAQTAASPGGILCMVLRLDFIGVILTLAARPLYVHLYRKFLFQTVGGGNLSVLWRHRRALFAHHPASPAPGLPCPGAPGVLRGRGMASAAWARCAQMLHGRMPP